MHKMPAAVNFCMRQQGILVQKGNPRNIRGIKDLGQPKITIVNRALGTGTRQLFDSELKRGGAQGQCHKGL